MLWNPPITHLSVDRRRSRVHGSGVCGANIDARNGAQPVRLAFGSDLAGAEVFIIANADTVSRPNAALITEFYPDVEVRGDLGEHETLLSIDKASRPLGYRTADGWRQTATPSLWCVMQPAGRWSSSHPPPERCARRPLMLETVLQTKQSTGDAWPPRPTAAA
jgi:hypothetical protein